MVRVFAAASKLGDGGATRQWQSRRCSIVARGGGEGSEKLDCEPVGQARGRFKSWPTMPRRPRRMAAWSGGQRWVSSTRHSFSETGQTV